MRMKIAIPYFIVVILLLTGNSYAQEFKKWAPAPPLGWNSYDCYDWRINEKEFKENVDYMEKNLLEYGYKYAVVDFLWYHIDPQGDIYYKDRKKYWRQLKYKEDGTPIDTMAMDRYGRLLPDEKRFPSAAGGKGFKPLADYVHGKGMKFGIHIMRGIPREAVFYNLPIKGTKYRAKDIAELQDTCSWENSMYGIDHAKPGAQEYYNSLLELYAQWGVDFIKADDTMYPVFHEKEIELISNAVKNCGRPIVLSLSLGEIPMSKAKFLAKSANMWRISDDFWDNWESLKKKFNLVDAWSNYISPGNWPDADMLPIGHLSINDGPRGKERMSQFTWPEHYTLMTLYSICKSPLFIGSDLPTMPDSTLFFLTNKEVLEVNQNSTNNHLVYKDWFDNVIWMADDPKTGDKYLALFNTGDKARDVTFDFELEYLRAKYKIKDLWKHEEKGTFEKSFTVNLPPHGAGLFRMSKVK